MEIAHFGTLKPFPSTTFVAEIDGAKALTLRSFYPRIAKVLLFPDYFGKNLDALYDCLCSLEVTGSQEVVLLIQNYDKFLSKEKADKREAANQVLLDSENAGNRYDGIVFRVVGVKPDRSIF
jgi:RNAse (barnase) inhibitor barstar